MDNLITSIVLLVISLGLMLILKEKIRERDIIIKIGIFSIIVAILGNILGNFVTIGFLIQGIAIVCAVMSLIIKVYVTIFKTIERITVKWGMFSLFLFMVFSILGSNSNLSTLGSEFFNSIILARILSVISILACILIEVFKIIFSKKSDKSMYDQEEILD